MTGDAAAIAGLTTVVAGLSAALAVMCVVDRDLGQARWALAALALVAAAACAWIAVAVLVEALA